MIIPDPVTSPVSYDLSELSLKERIKFVCKNPPRDRLRKDYIITLNGGTHIIMPTGFVTDYASVPRMFWAVPGFSPKGPLQWGAIPHDFGYQYQYLLAIKSAAAMANVNDVGRDLMMKYPNKFVDYVPVYAGESQQFFDQLLYDITIQKTGAKFVASTAKSVLEKFGHKAWNKYREHGPAAYNHNSLIYPGIGHGKGETYSYV